MTKGRPRPATQRLDRCQVHVVGSRAVRRVGMRGDQAANPVHPPGTDLGADEPLEAAQDEPAGHIVAAKLPETGGDGPGRVGVGEFGNESRFVPVMLHRLHVVAQHGGTGSQLCSGLVESGTVVAGGPHRRRRHPAKTGVPARQFVCPPELLGARPQSDAPSRQSCVEGRIPLGTHHPAPVHRFAPLRYAGHRASGALRGDQRVVVNERDFDTGRPRSLCLGSEVLIRSPGSQHVRRNQQHHARIFAARPTDHHPFCVRRGRLKPGQRAVRARCLRTASRLAHRWEQ